MGLAQLIRYFYLSQPRILARLDQSRDEISISLLVALVLGIHI